MLRKSLVFALVAMVALVAHAQKPIMAAGTFNASEHVDITYARQVRAAIVAGLFKTGRFELKDVDAESQIDNETARRSSEEALGDATALMEHTTETAAEYLLYGAVTQCSFKEETQKDSTVRYTAEIAHTVKIVRYSDKEVVVSKDYKLSGLRCGFGTSPEAAVTDALAHIKNDMKNLVDEYFPIEGIVLGDDPVTDKKGKKLVNCYINLGSEHGLKKGQRFEVSCADKIAGRDVTKVIGTIVIKEVMAGDISFCKVSEGGEDLLKKLNEYKEIKDTNPDKAIPLKIKSIKQSDAKDLLNQAGECLVSNVGASAIE